MGPVRFPEIALVAQEIAGRGIDQGDTAFDILHDDAFINAGEDTIQAFDFGFAAFGDGDQLATASLVCAGISPSLAATGIGG